MARRKTVTNAGMVASENEMLGFVKYLNQLAKDLTDKMNAAKNAVDNMQEQDEWLKQAYECTMVSGNRDLGHEILEHLEVGLEDEEKGELLNHAHEFRHQIDASWIN